MNRCRFLRVAILLGCSCWFAGGAPCTAGTHLVELIPELDATGSQVETIQAYDNGSDLLAVFGIYDSGASVFSMSYTDRFSFEVGGSQVPIKVPGGATADAIGGALVGDVSQPGAIVVDGAQALEITWDGVFVNWTINLDNAVTVPGVQMFVGASPGSEQLPNIAGTPVHVPTPENPNGVAAKIDMDGYELDLGEMFADMPGWGGPGGLFDGIVLTVPNVEFLPSPATLTAPATGTTPVLRVPVDLIGEDNHADPGDQVTAAPNPVQSSVSLIEGGLTVDDQVLLVDTGAMLSVISPEIADALSLGAPDTTIDVQGATGTPITVDGYYLDALEIPCDEDGDGVVDGTIRFENAPAFVLDLDIEGLDGILGMNLFNTADQMLYDPNDPLGASLQVTFFTDLERDIPDLSEVLALQLFADFLDPSFAGALGVGSSIPRFEINAPLDQPAVPEPSTVVLLLAGVAILLFARAAVRRRACRR